MRFYDIDSGSIKIDGVDTRDVKRSDVRSLFGMVLQDAWLYHASISKNIRFGKLDAAEYEVVDAAKQPMYTTLSEHCQTDMKWFLIKKQAIFLRGRSSF